MKFWYKKHHYNTHFGWAIGSRLSKYFGSYKTPLSTWIGHEDDCCDYWTPVSDPKAQRALMLDDDLKLAPTPNSEANKGDNND